MEVYLIRHGESLSNKERIVLGDSPLTELGIEQARNLKSIIPQDFDKIYASNLIRAEMTAWLAFGMEENDGKILIEPDLREIDLGDKLEGMHSDDIIVSKEDRRKWTMQIEDTFYEIYGTEPLVDFKKRTSNVFGKIIEKSMVENDQKIAIFSHGGTMRSILSHRLGLVPNDGLTFYNTEIIKLKLGNGSWDLIERKDDHIVGKHR